MPSIVAETLRLLARRWPQLLAWFLVGWLARYLLIELAALVGANFLLGGLLIMPLAILARLVSFVAMFLVLRHDLESVDAVATGDPRIGDLGARRRVREFTDAVLASILPFFAFYYAWGLLAADMRQYASSAIDNYFASADVFDPDRISYTEIDRLGFDALTIGLIVVAFAGRWALKRYRSRLPRWTSIVGVYLEAVWVFLTIYLIAGVFTSVREWVDGRVAMVWLGDAREWLGQFAAPLAWIWDAIQWALGEVGGLVLQPLAWLTIAGVVYGRTIAERRLQIPDLAQTRTARQRYERLPARLRRRLGDLWQEITARFRPVGRAIVTIWHAGAIPMGIFVLAYTVVMALQGWLRWGIVAVIGPHDLIEFWTIFDALLVLAVVAVTEPLRIALVAAAYDHAAARLAVAPAGEADAPAPEGAPAALEPAPGEDAATAPATPAGGVARSAAPTPPRESTP
ncbi:MAG TPA: hypothetical protein VFY91_04745 [Microbacterium sp.]|nr:hypothetical protein [Microbacterium sp.]